MASVTINAVTTTEAKRMTELSALPPIMVISTNIPVIVHLQRNLQILTFSQPKRNTDLKFEAL